MLIVIKKQTRIKATTFQAVQSLVGTPENIVRIGGRTTRTQEVKQSNFFSNTDLSNPGH